ncbi:MAG: bifunctional oligoribonuclease/PAP phosphatase NrnA [Syntrophomonadaceae bacterium]|jgi:phosphoesterase RecJ-like protein|nr:bifunctional oligoribonuclease/PAP phosphatase NrnA [Syntrophomonadaceae bacterium]MDH7498329.1 bifunctional oligoribonuclease/PAP phosphatase NrnA [Syntrophomonadaceae bacterium]
MKANDAWAEVAAAIRRHSGFVVVGHAIPDGDCVGSVVGMGHILASLGKQALLVLEDEMPPAYRFLAGSEQVLQPHAVQEWLPQVIYLDCTGRERAGDRLAACLEACPTIINIDHHVSNEYFGTINRVEPTAAATCEMLVTLADELGVPLEPRLATALYTGLLMDTGSFRYSNTRPHTLRTAARLLEAGVDVNRVRISLFESRSLQEVGLLRTALASLQFAAGGAVAWMTLRYEDLVALDAHAYHFEGLIDQARAVQGVEVALLFREIEPGLVKVGFRSKGRVDVNLLAGRLGGGGHPRAAGARLHGDLQSVQSRVLAMVEKAVHECTRSTGS